jgi:hypothetical protein
MSEMPDGAFRELAWRVIIQAARDVSCRPRKRADDERYRSRNAADAREFFDGPWCEYLCDLLGLPWAAIRKNPEQLAKLSGVTYKELYPVSETASNKTPYVKQFGLTDEARAFLRDNEWLANILGA